MKKTRVVSDMRVKPFLKWAGGKSQLLKPIMKAVETAQSEKRKFIYIEPFVGSGAVFLQVMEQFGGKVKKAVINDRNKDLIQAYRVIRDELPQLLNEMEKLKVSYYNQSTESSKKSLYYEIRDEFNKREAEWAKQTAMLIFLNKTCYNGLYRVNSKDEFNVPFGKYKNPGIYEKNKLEALHSLLQKVTILNEDFNDMLPYIDEHPNTFVYLDPPYRPISSTASFNAYAKDIFDDEEQMRLKQFCDRLHKKGSYWLLSNSDPKNIDAEDTFFEDLYSDYFIDRVEARRSINSNAAKRGNIHELLISNFEKKE